MKLRQKTFLTIGGLLIVFNMVVYQITATFMGINTRKIEEIEMRRNVDRSVEAFSRELEAVASTAIDHAEWDDTYKFVQDRNQEYLLSNYTEETFANLNINLLLIADNQGNIIFAQTYAKSTKEFVALPTLPFTPNQKYRGIVLLEGKPLLLASSPILTSKQEGPPRGWLVMGRYLDNFETQRLSEQTQLALSIQPLREQNLLSSEKSPLTSRKIDIKVKNSESIMGYTTILDIEEKPTLMLEVLSSRPIYAQLQQTLWHLGLAQTLTTTFFIVVVLGFIEINILDRLAPLHRWINIFIKEGTIPSNLTLKGNDELTSLAEKLNEMLFRLQQTETTVIKKNELLEMQNHWLSCVAVSESLHESLTLLAHLIELQVPGSICSILLLDKESRLRLGAAPSLPIEYINGIDGVTIGDNVGCCGTAIFRGEAVIASDIATDPLWKSYKEFALSFGLCSCWSCPIFSQSRNEILGTFAIYHREPRSPKKEHLELMKIAAYAAGIAIERHNSSQLTALQLKREQELVEQLQSELQQRRQAELKLQSTEEFLNSIIEHIPDMVFVKDGQTLQFISLNKAGEELLGYTAQDLIGKTDHDFFPREQADFFIANDRKVFEVGDVLDISEEIITDRNQKKHILHTKKVPIYDELGHPQFLLGISEDITVKKQTERDLQSTLQQLTHHIENSPLGTIRWDKNSCIERWSKRAEEIFGWTATEVMGKNLYSWSFVYEDDLDQAIACITKLLKGEHSTCCIRNYHKDGSIIYCEWYNSVSLNQEGELVSILSLVQDATDRKAAEILLREKTAELDQFFSVSLDLLCIASLDGYFLRLNPQWEKTLGYALKDLVGEEFLKFVHPDDLKDTLGAMKALESQQEVVGFINRYRCLDGSYRSIEWRSFPVGSFVYAAARDVTDRQEVDRLKNEFISIVSHEIRTPLTAIQGSLGILASGVYNNRPEKTQKMLHIAANNCERLHNLVNDILDLERLDSGKAILEMVPCQVTEILQQAIESVQTMAQKADIRIDCQVLDVQITADPFAVVQVLTNLLSNGIKFSPSQSSITVGTTIENINCIPHVVFWVQDRGRGIPRDKLDSIFGRFQQVDPSDARDKGGSGLGLAICKNIVEKHGGQIWVESVFGEGSTFYFTLPIEIDSSFVH